MAGERTWAQDEVIGLVNFLQRWRTRRSEQDMTAFQTLSFEPRPAWMKARKCRRPELARLLAGKDGRIQGRDGET